MLGLPEMRNLPQQLALAGRRTVGYSYASSANRLSVARLLATRRFVELMVAPIRREPCEPCGDRQVRRSRGYGPP